MVRLLRLCLSIVICVTISMPGWPSASLHAGLPISTRTTGWFENQALVQMRAINPTPEFSAQYSSEDFVRGATQFAEKVAANWKRARVGAPVDDLGSLSNRPSVHSAFAKFAFGKLLTLVQPENFNYAQLQTGAVRRVASKTLTAVLPISKAMRRAGRQLEGQKVAASLLDPEMTPLRAQNPALYWFYTVFGTHWEVLYWIPILNDRLHARLVARGRALAVPNARRIWSSAAVVSGLLFAGATILTPWLAIPAILGWAVPGAYVFSKAHRNLTASDRARIGVVGAVMGTLLLAPLSASLLGLPVPPLYGLHQTVVAVVWGLVLQAVPHAIHNVWALATGRRPAALLTPLLSAIRRSA
jgi:hypothetical protein